MDFEHPSIQEKARELIEGIPEEDDVGKAIKLFYFVRDQIRYSVRNAGESYNKENWKSSVILEKISNHHHLVL